MVDVATTDKGYRIVELNPTPNSGRYLSNLPLPMYQAVMREFNQDISPRITSPVVYIPDAEQSFQDDDEFDFDI